MTAKTNLCVRFLTGRNYFSVANIITINNVCSINFFQVNANKQLNSIRELLEAFLPSAVLPATHFAASCAPGSGKVKENVCLYDTNRLVENKPCNEVTKRCVTYQLTIKTTNAQHRATSRPTTHCLPTSQLKNKHRQRELFDLHFHSNSGFRFNQNSGIMTVRILNLICRLQIF